MAKSAERKKVNFMVSRQILSQIEQAVPAGKRSDFVNQALQEALLQFSRNQAVQGMDELAQKSGLKISTDEILKLKNYGRS